MSSTKAMRKIGKGIKLLVTRVPDRNHALVRFLDDPSTEQRAAIQFANDCLAIEPEYRSTSKHFRVSLEVVESYASFGFDLIDVDLPS